MRFTEKHVDKFVGLILYNVAKHTKTPSCSHFDMLQAGYLGLANALKTYDPSKHVPLKYWIYRIVNSQIIKIRYKNSKERKEVSGYNDIFFDEIDSKIQTPLDNLIEKEEGEIRTSRCESIMDVLNRVTKDNPINKELYIERILKGTRITELVAKYHLSYDAITHRTSTVTKRIKEELSKL